MGYNQERMETAPNLSGGELSNQCGTPGRVLGIYDPIEHVMCIRKRTHNQKEGQSKAFELEGDALKGVTMNLFQSQQPSKHDHPKQYQTLGPRARGSTTSIRGPISHQLSFQKRVQRRAI